MTKFLIKSFITLAVFHYAPTVLCAQNDPLAPPKEIGEAIKGARERTFNRSETDRLIFREVGRANLLSEPAGIGRIIVLDWANTYYHQARLSGASVDMKSFRSRLNEKLSEYERNTQVLKDSDSFKGGKEFYYAKMGIKAAGELAGALKVSAGAKAGAIAGEAVLSVLEESVNRSRGKELQIRMQDEYQDIAKYADRILDHSFELAHDSEYKAEYSDLFNKTFGPEVKALPNASAKANLGRDLQTAANLQTGQIYENVTKIKEELLRGIGPDGRLNVKLDKLNDLVADVHGDLREEIRNSTAQIKLALEETFKAAEGARELAEKKAAVHRLKYETASSSVYLLSGLAGTIDPRAGQVIGVTGKAAIEIASAIEKFSDTINMAEVAGKMLMSCVNLVAAIGNAVSMIMGLFFGGPSPEMMILEQLGKIAEQITELRAQMNDRFDKVDRSINRMFDAMMAGFREIDKQLHDIKGDLRDMKSALAGIEQGLVRLDSANYSYLKAGFYMPVIENIDLCLKHNPGMTLSQFRDCLSRLRTYATRHAANSLASGAVDAVLGRNGENLRDDDGFYSVLGDQLAKGVWNNLGVISAATELKFNDRSLRSGSAPLVNAEEWSSYVHALSYLVATHGDFVRQIPLEVLATTNAVLEGGDSLAQALNRLGSQTSLQDEKNMPVIVSSILHAVNDYKLKQEGLVMAMKKARGHYERTYLHSYNFTKDIADQETQNYFKRDSISPCASYSIPGDIPVTPILGAILGNLGEAVPKTFLAAETLGLGRIDVCYRGVAWDDERIDSSRLDEDKYYGKIGVSIEFSFHDAKGSYVFSRLRITSKEEIWYGVKVYYAGWEKVVVEPKPEEAKKYPKGVQKIELQVRRGPVKWSDYEWFDGKGKKNLREEQLKKHWNGPGGVAEVLLTKGRQALEPEVKKASEEYGVNLMSEFFAEERKRLEYFLREKLDEPGEVHRKAKALTGAKSFLESLIFLALPESFTSHGMLRGYFFGNEHALLDKDGLLSAYYQGVSIDVKEPVDSPEKPDDTNGLENGEIKPVGEKAKDKVTQGDIYSKNEKNIFELQKILEGLIATRGGKEGHSLIAEAQEELEMIKFTQSVIVPQEPVEQALGELRKAVEAFAE